MNGDDLTFPFPIFIMWKFHVQLRYFIRLFSLIDYQLFKKNTSTLWWFKQERLGINQQQLCFFMGYTVVGYLMGMVDIPVIFFFHALWKNNTIS